MESFGEWAAKWVIRKAGEWLAPTNGEQIHESDLEPEVGYLDDDAGRRVRIALPQGTGDGHHASIMLISSDREFIKAVSEYANDDGDYSQTVAIDDDGVALLYIPFAALIYPRAGKYKLSLVIAHVDSDTEDVTSRGRWTYEFRLPARKRWNKLTHLRPLIELCMMVVRADGGAVPEKVRQMRVSLTTLYNFSPAEVAELRDAMKSAVTKKVGLLVEQIWLRGFSLKVGGLLRLLSCIAKSDGDLTAGELSIIRETALSCDIEESSWPSVAEELGLALDDPWETLGVPRGATLSDIKAAYRRKITDCHPDRFGQVPREFQELATKITVNLQSAYERLKSRCEAS